MYCIFKYDSIIEIECIKKNTILSVIMRIMSVSAERFGFQAHTAVRANTPLTVPVTALGDGGQ